MRGYHEVGRRQSRQVSALVLIRERIQGKSKEGQTTHHLFTCFMFYSVLKTHFG